MFRNILHSGVAVVSLLLATNTASAQPTPGPYSGSYFNPQAYQHFLQSRSPYRTYFYSTPGYGRTYVSPFAVQYTYYEPAVVMQRITPYGFESYQYVPGYGGSTMTPFGSSGFTRRWRAASEKE